MSRLVFAIAAVAGLMAVSPLRAGTLVCAPVAVAEEIGAPGPLTISAADAQFGNPVLFWVDTETGDLQEHAEGGDRFITYTGRLDRQTADNEKIFLAHHAEQNELYRIDLGLSVHPFQRSVDGTLTAIGACVPAAMGALPEEDAAPVWPFTYRRGEH